MHLLRRASNTVMNELPTKIHVLTFRRLLTELKEHRPDICIRHRLLGQMWAKNFLRVAEITEQGVILKDETLNRFVKVSDLSHVMQFELDKPFQSFQPYLHYEVVVTGEW
jgi:hypothetical protein